MTMTDPRVKLGEQIAEVQREIKLRRTLYPSLVVRGKMRHAEADYHLACMLAVLDTLERTARERDHG